MKRKNVSKLVASVLIGSSLMMAGSTTSALADTNNAPVAKSSIINVFKSVPSGYKWIRTLGFEHGINVGWSEEDREVLFKDTSGKQRGVSLKAMEDDYFAINDNGQLKMHPDDFEYLIKKLRLKYIP